MNRRGLVQDVAFWAIIAFIFGVMVLVTINVMGSINDKYQETGASALSKSIQADAVARYSNIWDGFFLFLMFIMALAIIVLLYYLSSTPALFFVGIILIAVVGLPIAIIGNAFDEVQASDSMSASSAQTPITVWLMGHILEIGIGVAVLAAVLLFSRVGGGY